MTQNEGEMESWHTKGLTVLWKEVGGKRRGPANVRYEVCLGSDALPESGVGEATAELLSLAATMTARELCAECQLTFSAVSQPTFHQKMAGT